MLYIAVKINVAFMCPPVYHHNDNFVATHALRHMMSHDVCIIYIYIYIYAGYRERKLNNCFNLEKVIKLKNQHQYLYHVISRKIKRV